MHCGIYQILNIKNGKFYIGGTVNFKRRWLDHKKRLRSNKHHSPHLQAAWNLYGEESFEFKIVLICDKDDLDMYEQSFLDFYKPWDNEIGYNVQISVQSHRGMSPSKETREKLSKALKGRYFSPETRQKLSDAAKGRKKTPEQIEKQRKAVTGRKATDEERAKMSIAQSGKVLSEETKQKIGNSNRGKVRTEEQKEKLRTARLGKEPWNKGLKTSDEVKKKQSLAKKGKPGRIWTQEQKDKISATKKANNLKRCQELNQETINDDSTGT